MSVVYTFSNLEALRLEPGDLIKAVAAAQAGELTNGSPIAPFTPAKVAVCPAILEPELAGQWRGQSRDILREITPDIECLLAQGIEVVPGPGGLLSWEVWLYAPDGGKPLPNCGTPLSLSATPPNQAKPIVTIIRGNGRHQPRGRRAAPVSEEALLGLRQEGLGVKAIAARLGVSLMTVSRRLAELSQGRWNLKTEEGDV